MSDHQTSNWPEWTQITTPWNDPGGADPDEYTALCFRCQDAKRTPFTFDGTRVACEEWLQPHYDDAAPPAPPPPPPPHPKGR